MKKLILNIFLISFYSLVNAQSFWLHSNNKIEYGKHCEVVLPNGLITYSEWKFDEASGSTLLDALSAKNGIVYNEISRVTGISGNALYFTGNGYASMGDIYSGIYSTVSVIAWIKPINTTDSYQGLIFHGGSTDIDTYALYLQPSNQALAWKISGSSSNFQKVIGLSSIWDGNWHQVAATYDGETMKIYLDGSLISSQLSSGNIDFGYGHPLLIGAGRETPGLMYKGYIDEVRVYNSALTASEISMLYSNVSTYTSYYLTVTDSYLNDATIGNSGSTSPDSLSFISGTKIALADYFPNTGNNFVGYAADQLGTTLIDSITVSSTLTIYAIYDYAVSNPVLTVTESYINDANSSNSGSTSPSLASYTTGTNVILANDFPSSGNNFSHYSTSISGIDTITSVVLTSDSTVYSIFDYSQTDIISPSYTPTYYVSSSTGSDSNSGTDSDHPWQTIAKVNSIIPSPGDIITFKCGDNWNGTLSPPASGASGNSITYGAYGSGARPIIYGSEIVGGWSVYSGNIYQATLTNIPTQIFVDGIKLTVARFPNSGLIYPTTINSSTQWESTELNSSLDYTGATCMYFSSYAWSTSTITASSFQTITVDVAPSRLHTYNGFFIENSLELLDQPGEWYWNSSTNTLYAWLPNSDNPSLHTVRASTTDFGINCNSKNYISVRDIDFEHQKIVGAKIGGSHDVTVDNCIFNYPENTGIEAISGTQYNFTFTNNVLSGINKYGITVNVGSSYGGITISNNSVSNVGLLSNIGIGSTYSSAAISCRSSDSNISFNSISDVGYAGIIFNGISNVDHNYIFNCMCTLNDGGGIYTYSGTYSTSITSGSFVEYNIIENQTGTDRTNQGYRENTGTGIYLDDATKGVTVRNNTIIGSSNGMLMNVLSGLNVFSNNTLYNCGIALNANGNQLTDRNDISNNIVYATNRLVTTSWQIYTNEKLFRGTYDGTTTMIPTMDYNSYVSHFNSTDLFDSKETNGIWETFAYFQSYNGVDSNSTIDIYTLSTGIRDTILYNATNSTVNNNPGVTALYDLDGNIVSQPVSIPAWSSQIFTYQP